MTESPRSPGQVLDDLLREHGFMNFTLDCISRGVPARLTMNSETLFLASSDGTVASARFGDTDHSGTELERTVRLGPTRYDIAFDSAPDAERFARVLDVRRGVSAPARPLPRDPLGDDPIAVANGTVGTVGSADSAWLRGRTRPALRKQYTQNADVALTAAMVLIVAGGLVGLGGLLIALISLMHGSGLGFLYGIVTAVVGSATPVCLGCLTRAVIFRFAWEDTSPS